MIMVFFLPGIFQNRSNTRYEKYDPLKIDFLKAFHHDSYTSTSPYLIGNILPEYAIISTNGKYDHPSSETLDTLERYMVRYFITKYTEMWISFFRTAASNKNRNNCCI